MKGRKLLLASLGAALLLGLQIVGQPDGQKVRDTAVDRKLECTPQLHPAPAAVVHPKRRTLPDRRGAGREHPDHQQRQPAHLQ